MELRIPYKNLKVGLCRGNCYEYQKIVLTGDRLELHYVYYIGPCGSILHRYDTTTKDADNHPMYTPIITYYTGDGNRRDVRAHCIQDAAYYDGRFYVVSYYVGEDGRTTYRCTSVDEEFKNEETIDLPWTVSADHLYSLEPVSIETDYYDGRCFLKMERELVRELTDGNWVSVYDPDEKMISKLLTCDRRPWTLIDLKNDGLLFHA